MFVCVVFGIRSCSYIYCSCVCLVVWHVIYSSKMLDESMIIAGLYISMIRVQCCFLYTVKSVHVMIQITVYVVNEIKTRKIKFFWKLLHLFPT